MTSPMASTITMSRLDHHRMTTSFSIQSIRRLPPSVANNGLALAIISPPSPTGPRTTTSSSYVTMLRNTALKLLSRHPMANIQMISHRRHHQRFLRNRRTNGFILLRLRRCYIVNSPAAAAAIILPLSKPNKHT